MKRALISGALTIVVVLAACTHPDEEVEHPLTDEAARAQVVEPARQINAIGHLQRTTGGYALISCHNATDPPYQGVVYMSFALPADAFGYFRNLTSAMVASGWTEGPSPNHDAPGTMLSKDAVTAVFGRDSAHLEVGTARIYGQCRNVGDHRHDAAAWVDITDQLG
jgi:hypothetical protein